jgi:hypothetical protein
MNSLKIRVELFTHVLDSQAFTVGNSLCDTSQTAFGDVVGLLFTDWHRSCCGTFNVISHYGTWWIGLDTVAPEHRHWELDCYGGRNVLPPLFQLNTPWLCAVCSGFLGRCIVVLILFDFLAYLATLSNLRRYIPSTGLNIVIDLNEISCVSDISRIHNYNTVRLVSH